MSEPKQSSSRLQQDFKNKVGYVTHLVLDGRDTLNGVKSRLGRGGVRLGGLAQSFEALRKLDCLNLSGLHGLL